ncbi:MAG: hypothetical protein HPY58_13400 [Firmicutes bacterium]|nr:hypothetical protein [Bacillota bacterium]
MPVGGMWGSDLLKIRPEMYQVMKSPFDGKEVVCVKSLQPDWALVHVHEADEMGNARIYGNTFQDVLLTRAAKRTIITAERIVPTETFREKPELTTIPYIFVEAVVEAPKGAAPGPCWPDYPLPDRDGMKAYLGAVKNDAVSEWL